jgi:hypothetical protein
MSRARCAARTVYGASRRLLAVSIPESLDSLGETTLVRLSAAVKAAEAHNVFDSGRCGMLRTPQLAANVFQQMKRESWPGAAHRPQ